MKELTLSTILAVFEEMFGWWVFWALVLVALLCLVAFFFVIARERGLNLRRLVISELVALVGGILSVAFVLFITSSRLSDLGGPVDVLVLIGIWAAGAIGTQVAVYAALGLTRIMVPSSAQS